MPATASSDEQIMARLSRNLRRILKQRGITKYRLSKMTGLSEQAVGHVVRGRHMPLIHKLVSIAEALGVSLEELLR